MPEFNEENQIPTPSEGFGKVPNGSESFRMVRNDSEGFRSVPTTSERRQNHTLTVREVARMFEAAGVARTERRIVNWCQFNAQGVARLDAYFDPNERKYFITPQSVERAIAEEKAKAVKGNTVSEPAGNVPNGSESGSTDTNETSENDLQRAAALEKQVMDLKILHSGKDYLIEQLRQERDGFFSQLLDASRKVGQLETRLLQLKEPASESVATEKGVVEPRN